jgi:NitT/TauT family transport system ATP-binding protein
MNNTFNSTNTFNSNNTSKSINIENISFAYEDKIVFENYSQRFPIGETSVIMAPSGFGKTTLLYMISGLISPTNGNINIPINNPKFSFAFQDLRLIESLNVKKNITLVNSNISTNDLDKCLEALAIKDLADKKVSTLSGGEKSRVSIARALMADYDILLLDEPFNGLDDTTKDKVIKYIKEKTVHKTVLLVTHNNDEADYFK